MKSRSLLVVEVVAEMSREPFEYGVLDCCLFAARAVKAVTGHDYSGDWRYSTKEQASAILQAKSGLRAFVTGVTGVKPVDKGSTLDGDPLLLRLPPSLSPGELLAVRMGEFAVYKTMRGISKIPITSHHVECGWRID